MDQELLKAIGQMMDDKLQPVHQEISTLREDLSEVKQDMSGVKQDLAGVKQDLAGVKQDLAGVKQEISTLREDLSEVKQDMSGVKQDLSEVKITATRTAIIQENEIVGKIQLIYENQMSIIDSNRRLDKQDLRIETVETDVFALKHAYNDLKKAT